MVWLGILMNSAAHGAGHDMGQRRGDAPDPMRPRFDDSSWSEVTLPHTYNAEDGERSGGYYRGIGWYRRTIDISSLSANRRTYLQFDGAALITDVWINGQHAGRHEGGYAAREWRGPDERSSHRSHRVMEERTVAPWL